MKSPLQRIRLGAVVMSTVVIAAVVGYQALGYRWVDALWMVVITISSVGYGEQSAVDDRTKMFSIAVIFANKRIFW